MDFRKRSIICECGNFIDTSDHPQTAMCTECNRKYARQANTLILLEKEEVICPGAVVIM